jgi:hypothetical protein
MHGSRCLSLHAVFLSAPHPPSEQNQSLHGRQQIPTTEGAQWQSQGTTESSRIPANQKSVFSSPWPEIISILIVIVNSNLFAQKNHNPVMNDLAARLIEARERAALDK